MKTMMGRSTATFRVRREEIEAGQRELVSRDIGYQSGSSNC
jgi:hypothetical protein